MRMGLAIIIGMVFCLALPSMADTVPSLKRDELPAGPPLRQDFDIVISKLAATPLLKRDELPAAAPMRQDFDITLKLVDKPPALKRDELPSAPAERHDFDITLPKDIQATK